MNQTNVKSFIEQYTTFRDSDLYKERMAQKAIVPVFREIIWEVLKNEKITNQHLTDLIQITKHNCSNENFDHKLEALVKDGDTRNRLSDQAYEIEQPGYVNAGKTGISGLTPKQLTVVRQFLLDAYKVKSKKEAIVLSETFDENEIPQVKRGIYSPWLYYINPEIFPIVNNSHQNFKKWLGLSNNYPDTIEQYHQLNELINEKDFGGLDYFAHHLGTDGNLNIKRVLYLDGHKLFKISHGVFVKRPGFVNSGIIKILENNNWIALSKYTGRGAGKAFETELKIGDVVYLCYGGDKIISVAKVISDAKLFSNEHAALIGDEDEEWIYREIEPLYFPVESDISDLKDFRSQTMPSGNSTFWEIKSNDLDYMNENLFVPKFNLEIFNNKNEENDAGEGDEKFTENLEPMALNTILFGPPGTGKTFHSISYSVAIVENKSIESILAEERGVVKNRFDQYIQTGQIVFSTFHQSLSYEDFIEGIKPVEPNSEDEELSYSVEDGVFKRLCTEAAFSFVQKNATTETEKVLDFSTEYDRYVDSVNERFSRGERTELETRSGGNVYIESISQKNNIWVRHINGSRKYTVSKKRLSKISQSFPELSEVTNINDQFRAEIGGSNSSAYWAVLNAIRNQPSMTIPQETKTLSEKDYLYDDKKEIIKSLKNDDYQIVNPKKFVLIIDEINRGNVSQIFGELITLVEDDKRLGREESLKATLPYSKDSFGVPCNVYILGTMNTADRSVEALDTALRRRFAFVAQMPDESKLKITEEGIDLPKLLQTINNRLRVLKDNDHTIGHAWLWEVSNLQQLKNVFQNKILPLLQEFFYNDYEKLGLVLGDAFFELPHKRVAGNEFAPFSGSNGLSGQYRNKYIFQLKKVRDLGMAEFLSLTQSTVVNEF